MDEWRGRVLTGCMSDDRVPGCGEATIRSLESKFPGMEDKATYMLIGTFLSLFDQEALKGGGVMAVCDKFKEQLAEWETPAAHRDTVVTAIAEKVFAGFRMPMQMDEDRLSSSRMNHEKMEAFLSKELTGDCAKDFSGIGDKAAAQLPNYGVETSYQLFGFALTSKDANEFEDALKEAGVAGGWSATVVHQVVEKLANGVRLPSD